MHVHPERRMAIMDKVHDIMSVWLIYNSCFIGN